MHASGFSALWAPDHFVWVFGMFCAFAFPFLDNQLELLDSLPAAKRVPAKAILLAATLALRLWWCLTYFSLPKRSYNKVRQSRRLHVWRSQPFADAPPMCRRCAADAPPMRRRCAAPMRRRYAADTPPMLRRCVSHTTSRAWATRRWSYLGCSNAKKVLVSGRL